MSDAAVLFKKFRFDHEGDREIGRPTIGIEGAYAAHLERETAKFLARQRDALGPQAYQDSLRINLASGVNNWFGWCRPGFMESLSDPSNAAKFLYLWFAKFYKAPDPLAISEAQMQAYYRDPVVRQKLDGLLNEALSDPNPLPPD